MPALHRHSNDLTGHTDRGVLPGMASPLTTIEKPGLTDEQIADCRRVVAGAQACRDAADCRLLFDYLGLLPEDGDT